MVQGKFYPILDQIYFYTYLLYLYFLLVLIPIYSILSVFVVARVVEKFSMCPCTRGTDVLAVSFLAKSTDVIENTRSRLLIVPRPSAYLGPWRTEISLRVFPGRADLRWSLGKMN